MRYDLHPDYQEKETFLLHIDNTFSKATNTLHKARNEIKIIDGMVVKSFKIPHFINKIAYTFFRDSKAKKSFYNSLKLQDFTPKPIAYVEHLSFGLLNKSYYISEDFAYDFTIREVLKNNKFQDRKNIFKAFAYFSYQLHEKGIKHLDYSPGNILIKKDAETYHFKIVDVNRMVFKRLSIKERLENFSKLWADERDLDYIITHYSQNLHIPKEEAITIALAASKKHKSRKNMKKRLKGIEVVD